LHGFVQRGSCRGKVAEGELCFTEVKEGVEIGLEVFLVFEEFNSLLRLASVDEENCVEELGLLGGNRVARLEGSQGALVVSKSHLNESFVQCCLRHNSSTFL